MNPAPTFFCPTLCHFDQREKSGVNRAFDKEDFSLAQTGLTSLAAYAKSKRQGGQGGRFRLH